MRVRRTAAHIVSRFQLVRAQVHWHICTHLHYYSLFQCRDSTGFPESCSFHTIYGPTTGHESQRNGQKVASAVREPPEQGVFFLKDLNKTEEINEFSEESKKLITDMNNTVVFELCETSSKKQRADCVLYHLTGNDYNYRSFVFELI